MHLIPMDEDEEDQCIRLLSFCKKHRAVSNERPAVDEWVAQKACEHSDYTPPPNPSGCARSGMLFLFSITIYMSQICYSIICCFLK